MNYKTKIVVFLIISFFVYFSSFLILPFMNYSQINSNSGLMGNYFYLLLIGIFSMIIQIMLIYFVYKDAENKIWIIAPIIFGWFGALIYLIFSNSIKPKNGFYSSYKTKNNSKFKLNNSINSNFFKKLNDSFNKKSKKEVSYYDNGKPVYKKD